MRISVLASAMAGIAGVDCSMQSSCLSRASYLVFEGDGSAGAPAASTALNFGEAWGAAGLGELGIRVLKQHAEAASRLARDNTAVCGEAV